MKVFCENQSSLCTDLFKRIEVLTKDCTLEKSEQINSLMFLYKENFSKKYLSLVQRIGIPELNSDNLEEYLIDSGFSFIAERYDFSPKQIPFQLDFCNQIGNVHISNLDPILPTLITITPAVASLPIMYFSLFEIIHLNDYITKFNYPSLKEWLYLTHRQIIYSSWFSNESWFEKTVNFLFSKKGNMGMKYQKVYYKEITENANNQFLKKWVFDHKIPENSGFLENVKEVGPLNKKFLNICYPDKNFIAITGTSFLVIAIYLIIK